MAHTTWDIERAAKGVRATVQVWPTGEAKRAGMRYRKMRGPWHNSGSEDRDMYLSKMDLQKRLSELERSFHGT